MQNDSSSAALETANLNIRKRYFVLFILFFITYSYFFQGGGWNQNGRICLTRAIIEHGTFTIDQYKEDSPQMAFINTGDWAFYNGHYYCNKSPGISFLAVPPFALSQYFLKHIFPNNPARQVLYSTYVSTVCTVVLMSSLLCLLMFHVCCDLFSMGLTSSFLLTVFFGFGTLAFPYSTSFYCHQPAAFCSFLSLVLAMQIRHDNSSRKPALAVISGLFAGLGVLIEPSCIYLLGAVVIYLLWFQESRRYLWLFIIGCLPSGLAQGFYNYVCFGNPLASSYHYANDAVMWKVDGRLFGFPRLKTLFQLTLAPYRGLFFSSPVLLMAVPGTILFCLKRNWRPEALYCTGMSLFFILFIASFHAWHGGSAPGPRYLLPAYPLFFLLTIFSFQRFSLLFKIIGTGSILINLAITIVGIEIPREIQNPLFDVVLRNIIAGRVSMNPVPLSHFNDMPDVFALSRFELWHTISNFNSFNLGEILFPHTIASIVPLVIFWILWGCLFWRQFYSAENARHG